MRALLGLLITSFAYTSAVAAPSFWDDAKVTEQSQAFLKTFDTFDAGAYETLADPAIVNFETGRTYDLAILKSIFQQLVDAKAPVRTRTCDKQRVTRTKTTIVYVDRCQFSIPAHGDVPALTFPKYDSIVWAYRDGDWKVVYYAEMSAGLDSEKEAWDETFRVGVNFKTTANQHLIDTGKGA